MNTFLFSSTQTNERLLEWTWCLCHGTWDRQCVHGKTLGTVKTVHVSGERPCGMLGSLVCGKYTLWRKSGKRDSTAFCSHAGSLQKRSLSAASCCGYDSKTVVECQKKKRQASIVPATPLHWMAILSASSWACLHAASFPTRCSRPDASIFP